MNQFTVLVLLLVVFCYCGGKYCPAVLKQNKEILLGVVGGLVLSSFFGLKLEGAVGGGAVGEISDQVWDQWINGGCCSTETGTQPKCMNMLGLTNVNDLYQKIYPTLYGSGGKCSAWCKENPGC